MASLSHLLRAVRFLARDDQIPRGLRWLAVFGILPIPGPVDEVALLALAAVLLVFHRDRLASAWRASGAPQP